MADSPNSRSASRILGVVGVGGLGIGVSVGGRVGGVGGIVAVAVGPGGGGKVGVSSGAGVRMGVEVGSPGWAEIGGEVEVSCWLYSARQSAEARPTPKTTVSVTSKVRSQRVRLKNSPFFSGVMVTFRLLKIYWVVVRICQSEPSF